VWIGRRLRARFGAHEPKPWLAVALRQWRSACKEPVMPKEPKDPKIENRKETEKPWARPGQVAQNPGEKAPSKKDVGFKQASKTS
jgi:hypothetical protein